MQSVVDSNPTWANSFFIFSFASGVSVFLFFFLSISRFHVHVHVPLLSYDFVERFRKRATFWKLCHMHVHMYIVYPWKAIISTHCVTSAGSVQYSTVYYDILYYIIILCHSQYSLITNTKCLHTIHSSQYIFYSVVRKMAQYMSDILDPEDRDRLHENLLVGPGKLPMEVSIFHVLYIIQYTLYFVTLKVLYMYKKGFIYFEWFVFH